MQVQPARANKIATAQRNRRNRLLLGVAAVIGLSLFLAHEVLGRNGYWARRQQLRQIDALTSEISAIERQNAALAERIRALRNDPEAIEEAARERLHLARPGEVVIAIPANKPPADTNPHPSGQ